MSVGYRKIEVDATIESKSGPNLLGVVSYVQ